MTSIRNTLMGIGVAIASLGALAQKADEHKDHHPAGANAPVATAPARAASAPGMAGMDQHMKSMQAMHEKMMSAKTPEDRQALMAEHMKLMQDGMAMMKGMGSQGMGGMGKAGGSNMGGGMTERQQMMEKRMDMMESMMQMMMDRMPPAMGK